MSRLFICDRHRHVCVTVDLDEQAVAIAEADRVTFADRWKAMHGDFPPMKEQEERFAMAYEMAARKAAR